MLNYLLGCICTRLKAPFGRVAKCRLVDFVDGCCVGELMRRPKARPSRAGMRLSGRAAAICEVTGFQIRDENVLN